MVQFAARPLVSRFFGLRNMLTAAVAMSVLAAPINAHAQTDRTALQDRVARMESAVEDLQARVYAVNISNYDAQAYTQGAPVENRSYSGQPTTYPSSSASTPSADLTFRIDTLEMELQRITGRLEEIAFQQDKQARQLDTLTQAVSLMAANSPAETSTYSDGYDSATQTPRVADGGSYYDAGDLPAVSGPEDLAQPSSVSISLPDNPKEAYDYAYQTLLDGKYAEAEAGFLTFLQRYPDDMRAPDAKFRLGEIYLVTGAYGEAASTFLDHIKTWPNDIRAPESYLKLGTSFSRAGKASEACKVFNALQSKYPNASGSVVQRLSIERGKAGC